MLAIVRHEGRRSTPAEIDAMHSEGTTRRGAEVLLQSGLLRPEDRVGLEAIDDGAA